MTKLVKDAPTIWNALKGVLCIYKPAECKTERVREKLIYKLCKELNEMECRPPEEYVRIIGDPTKKLVVRVEENLADHPLVVGARYQQNDIVLSWSNYLGYNTSGVLLFGLRSGTKYAKYIRENRPTRAYRIKGCLGNATDNGYKDGKIVEKSTWRFIHRYHMEKLLTTMQQAHQKKMFEMCGVDLQSELAYELATKGLVRPANSKIPIIYGIKCVEFDAPNFTLELQCINEDEKYLINLIHEIGIKLHSTAHCTGIQCIRHSYFTLDDALLEKFWDLQNLITNLQHCNDVINNNMHLLKQDSVNLRQ